MQPQYMEICLVLGIDCCGFACAGFFFTSRSIPPLAALQLVATNEIMARMVQNLIRKQRLYLRTAMNDAVCAYVFFLSLFNVLIRHRGQGRRSEDPSSFSVESDIEASSSPSSGRLRDWYDLGSGEVLHFTSLLMAYGRRWRSCDDHEPSTKPSEKNLHC